MVINRIGAFSLAKLAGTFYAIVGLLVGAIVSLAAMVGAFGSEQTAGLPGMLFGVASIVVLPIVYGCLGFFVSLIGATPYNALAKLVGGVELDIT